MADSTTKITPALAPEQGKTPQISDEDKATADKDFQKYLHEFLQKLQQRFPNAKNIARTLQMSQAFCNASAMQTKRAAWATASKDILQEVMDKDFPPVAKAVSTVPIVKNIGFAEIMMDPGTDDATKDAIWKYIQILTAVSQYGTGVKMPKARATAITPMACPSVAIPTDAGATQQTEPAASTESKKATPTPASLIEGVVDGIPKIMQSLNKVLEENNGDNPIANIIKQFSDPSKPAPGVMNNLAAYMMEKEQGTAMGGVDGDVNNLTFADMMNRLKRVERENNKLKKKLGRSEKKSE